MCVFKFEEPTRTSSLGARTNGRTIVLDCLDDGDVAVSRSEVGIVAVLEENCGDFGTVVEDGELKRRHRHVSLLPVREPKFATATQQVPTEPSGCYM